MGTSLMLLVSPVLFWLRQVRLSVVENVTFHDFLHDWMLISLAALKPEGPGSTH